MFDAVDGFDDEDLEKPNFSGKPSSAKIPYILSAPDETPVVQVPAAINQYLRKYQQEGIAFLYKQYCARKGAILADDMGLGKTVQVIGFISAILGKTGTKADIYGKFFNTSESDEMAECNVKRENGAFLIVSPHSVLYNWRDELITWGHFRIGIFHRNKRAEALERATMNRLDVVLTTYETLRNHWERLDTIQWLALIMDEVHHLKDPKTAVTIAAKSLNVKCRIGLTGTPLHNRLVEFWCVLDWANPGCLGDKENFANQFGKPIMQGQRFDVTKRELATGRIKTQEFQSMIDEWCLRRTKTLISDQLPQKDQKVVFCPLSKLQVDIYKTLLQLPDVKLVLKQGEPCDCRSGLSRGHCCYSKNEEGFTMRRLMLQYLRLLLKVANHAGLLLPQVKQTEEQRKRAASICEKVFSAHPDFEEASKSPSIELFSDSNFCGKMKVLDKLLMLFQQQKDKVLIFSYSTQLLDMLEVYVVSCGMVYRRLDGKTRGERRLRVVKEFNTIADIFLFLVSTKTGGVGLNLTSANVVIVFDPSWNPANDLQAEDRAYRIGQTRDVKVFRLIAGGTIEENIYLRQVYKQQLANVAVEGNNERRYFTAVDGERDKKGELFGIENLFALRSDGCCVSSDIFKRSDKIEKGFRMAKYELKPEKKEIGDNLIDLGVAFDDHEEEVEDQRYDLDDVASQFIGDETNGEEEKSVSTNNGAHNCERKGTNEIVSSIGTEKNLHEKSPEDLGKPETKEQPVECTEVGNTSEKGAVCKRRSQLPQTEDERKRRRNQKKLPTSEDSQVNQIFADCGVQHTHSNTVIIGTSIAENEMTTRAMKEVFQLGQCSQQPANCFIATESDGEESDDIGDYGQESFAKTNDEKDLVKSGEPVKSSTERVQKEMSVSKIGGTSVIFGETPKAIRLRQFSEMSWSHGRKSQVDFANFVLNSNTPDQLLLLKEYYESKEYPVDCLLRYPCNAPSISETEGIEDKKTTECIDNKKATKRHFKNKGSLRLSCSRRHRRPLGKSHGHVLKEPVVRSNSRERPKKGGSKQKHEGDKSRISKPPSRTFTKVSEKVKTANDATEWSGKDNARISSASRNNVHKSIHTDNVLTSESQDKIENLEDESRPAINDLTILSSSDTEGCEKVHPASFLDEFLYECSQRKPTTSKNAEDFLSESRNNENQSISRASYRNVQSVFDDLM